MNTEYIYAILICLAVVLLLSQNRIRDALLVVPTNIMDANAWEIGPIMGLENMSKGVPLHPTAHPDGWCIDIPYPTPDAGHVHYVTVPTGSLEEKVGIEMHFRLEMAIDTLLCPVKSPDAPSLLTLYFQRRGDNWSMDGEYETYRWYASFATITDLRAGEYVVKARFDQNWTALQTSSRESNPDAFRAASQNACRIGFVMGGGDGLGHGVFATAPALLVVTKFEVV